MSVVVPGAAAIAPVAAPVSAPASGPLSAGAGTGVDTSRLASRANLDKAGKQFEAVFANMMLKAMRQAHLASDLFDSKALDTFREMQDGHIAQAIADHAPLGIGKAVTDFLAKANADLAPSTAQPLVGAAAAGPPAGRAAPGAAA